MHGDQNHGHSVAGPMPSDRMWWGRQWGLGPVRRSQGDSFVALVSFITGIAIMDERTGARCSPNHPNKLPGYIVSAPEKAPARFTDRPPLSTIDNAHTRSELLDNSIVGHYWMVIANRQHSEFDYFAVVMQVANE